VHLDGGDITTSVGVAHGGDITIDPVFVILRHGGSITSEALDEMGQGGVGQGRLLAMCLPRRGACSHKVG
jgi:hypothetical protein